MVPDPISWCAPPYLSKDCDNHESAHHQRRNRPANDQRKPLTRKSPELTALGFDLSADGDADERDEDQRAGGGYATPAQISRLTWL
jgi:hypothetical protein